VRPGRFGIQQQVDMVSMAPNDFRSVLQTNTRCQPDEIYNLAGQTPVGLSFDQPVETIQSSAIMTYPLRHSSCGC